MQILQRFQDLVAPTQHIRESERALTELKQLRQVFTRNELHHQILRVIFGKVIDDVRQRWMTKVGQQTCFVLERLARFWGRNNSLFDGDDAAEPLVYGFIN